MRGQCHLVGSGRRGNKVLEKMKCKVCVADLRWFFRLFQYNIKMIMNDDMSNGRMKTIKWK